MGIETIIALALGVAIGAGVIWFFTRGNSTAAETPPVAGGQDKIDWLYQQNAALIDAVSKLEAEMKASSEERQRTETRQNSQIEALRGAVDSSSANMSERLDRFTASTNQRLDATTSHVTKAAAEVGRGAERMSELAGVAADVKQLNRVLTGVKTRGNLGEAQLASLLGEVLSPNMYETNVVTKRGSRERVEFAVKIPVKGGEVLLPIDSKFPADAARDANEKTLKTRLAQEAKDISEKYVCPPDTTDFGILFIPYEGLFSQVISIPRIVEYIYKTYRVVICGPSTLFATVDTVKLIYQRFGTEKKNQDAIDMLIEARSELDKYCDTIDKLESQLVTAQRTLETLKTTRTNVLRKKIEKVFEADTVR